MKHFHTTSGKVLNKTYEPTTTFITCEYRPDGQAFITAAYDGIIRTYDEQTRQLVSNLSGGGTGLPGHQSRVTCAKYVPEDHNIIVSGGWDGQVCIWDVRTAACARKIVGLNICGDSIDIHDGFILSGQYRDKDQLNLHYLHDGELAEKLTYNEKLPSEKECSIFTCQF